MSVNKWQPAINAPDDFADTYFLVRLAGLHPATNKPYVPMVVTRCGNELYKATDHIDPIQFPIGDGGMFATSDIRKLDLEWFPLPE